jgi:hypothetical protein
MRPSSRAIMMIAEDVQHYGGGVQSPRFISRWLLQAVDDVSFEVRRDEVLALVGERMWQEHARPAARASAPDGGACASSNARPEPSDG